MRDFFISIECWQSAEQSVDYSGKKELKNEPCLFAHLTWCHMKQRNVQQQNQITESMIRGVASYWRNCSLPIALIECASSRGVDSMEAIVLDLGIDESGIPELEGILLTSEGRFIEFDIETDPSHTLINVVLTWKDVTSMQNLSLNNPGFGAGYGALALKILQEMRKNSEPSKGR